MHPHLWQNMSKPLELSLVIHIDGASKGNPGPAGVGAVIHDTHGRLLVQLSSYIGRATNNQAEYKALITALDYAAKLKAVHITIRTDSQLVAEHIKGNYRVRNRGLMPLYQEAMRLLSSFQTYSIEYIPRFLNTEADALANDAIKTHSS